MADSKAATALNKNLTELKNIIEKQKARVIEINDTILQKEIDKDEILFAPVSKAQYKSYLLEMYAKAASGVKSKLEERIERNSDLTAFNFLKEGGALVPFNDGIFSQEITANELLFYFPEIIADKVIAQIASEMFDENAKDKATRESEIAAIEAETDALEKERDEIIQFLISNGLELD